MQIHFKTAELKKYLPLLLAVTEEKTTLPILENFLIDADRGTISATDLNNYMTIEIPSVKAIGGRATIPAKQFSEFISKLTDQEEVDVSSLENNWVKVTTGNRTCTMPGMSTKSWPTFTAKPDDTHLLIPSDVLTRFLDKTTFAISKEESRYVLNGALLTTGDGDGYLKMVTTDGHRMALIRTKQFILQKHEEKSFTNMIMTSTLSLLRKFQPQEFSIGITKSEDILHFVQGPIHISSKVLVGQFPNYKAVIPKDINVPTATVDAYALGNAIEAAVAFSDQRTLAVHLKLDSGKLTVTAAYPEHGNFSDEIEASCQSVTIYMTFHGSYITEFLEHAGRNDSNNVQMFFKAKDQAGAFRSVADGEDYLYIVMPMRY